MAEITKNILDNFTTYIEDELREYFSSEQKKDFFETIKNEDQEVLEESQEFFNTFEYKNIKKIYKRFFHYLEPNQVEYLYKKYPNLNPVFYVAVILEGRYFIKRSILKIIQSPLDEDEEVLDRRKEDLQAVIEGYNEIFIDFFKTGKFDI